LRLGLGLGLGERDALAWVGQAQHPRVDLEDELHDLLALLLGWYVAGCSAEHVVLSFSVAVMAAILGALSVSVRSYVERGEGGGRRGRGGRDRATVVRRRHVGRGRYRRK